MQKYNREFQTIDTEEKAYVYGLFLADGCLSTKNSIRISLIDEEIIDKIVIRYPFFNKGSFDYSKYNLNNKVQYSLVKKSKELCEDFISHGYINRKSTDNSEQLRLPSIDNKLIRHVLRGYFDGNGSISVPTKRPNGRRAEFCSSSRTLINDIIDVLKNNNFDIPVFKEKENPNTILYVIEWWKTSDIELLRDYLYKDATIYLNRKFELFNSLKLVDKKDNNPPCPYCYQKLTIKNGKRVTNEVLYYRYKCTFCSKSFQILAQIKEDELLESH